MKTNIKVEKDYSEFTTTFRIENKECNESISNCFDWRDILGTWSEICINALESRMESCVSMLFRNRDNIIKSNEDLIVFKKQNGSIHSFNHKSFRTMEDLIIDIKKGNWEYIEDNRLGCLQLLKALYWVPEEDRKEICGIGFEKLITVVVGLTAR